MTTDSSMSSSSSSSGNNISRHNNSPAFLSFVQSCLHWDPKDRIAATDALHHVYIAGLPTLFPSAPAMLRSPPSGSGSPALCNSATSATLAQFLAASYTSGSSRISDL